MTEFMAKRGDYEKYATAQKQHARLCVELAELIRKNVRYSFSSTVLLDDWRSANSAFYMEECRLNPYSIGAFSVMCKAIGWLGKNRKAFTEFVFEKGDNGQADFKWLMDQAIRCDSSVLAPVEPVFRSKSIVPLQSADFAVWQHRRQVKLALDGQEQLDSKANAIIEKIPHDWGVIDRNKIIEWVDWLGVPRRAASFPYDARKAWVPKFPGLAPPEPS